MNFRLNLIVFLLLVLGSGAVSCSSYGAQVTLSGGCRTSADCPYGYFCQHPDRPPQCGTCRIVDPSLHECDEDNPCPSGQICIGVQKDCYCTGIAVCIDPCNIAGCPATHRCREDGTCEPLPCTSDDECQEAFCIAGRCSSSPGYCESKEPRP